MAQTLSLNGASSTAAPFRAWGSAISAAIATNGQVQTADTGQINWTTVAAPSGASTAMGYEIWRFSDALQSTAPVYFKIEYGSGVGATSPGMWITVGTGSDGAGTITGTNITNVFTALTARRTVMPAASTHPGIAGNVYVNGDSGCLALCGWLALNVNHGGFVLLIERTRAWDGTATGDGFVLVTSCNGISDGIANCNPISYVPSAQLNSTTVGTYFASPGGSANSALSPLTCVVSGVLYPQPVPTSSGPRPGAPSQYVMAICPGDYAPNATFSMAHYGTSRTWISAGVGCGSSSSYFGSWGNGNIKSFIFRTT